ncbi:hypothetical protein [Paludisphaera rhizosphaerae]|uniref:hypothetical protein n=1 Tax=Paludisphaera rhizosphaerae TaxID=2711216 RepID=UPI0013EC75D5|nr:hypothetical protein [Paludisphaera rhizosphaerae]
MKRSSLAPSAFAALGLLTLPGAGAFGQAPTDSKPVTPLVTAEAPPLAGHRCLVHHRHEPACATCVAVQSTTTTTAYNYASKSRVVCYPKERCSCLRCVFHLHGHHQGCEPVVKAVVKRDLVKTKVTEEKQETTYEGSLAPAPPPASCRLHGLGCRGEH